MTKFSLWIRWLKSTGGHWYDDAEDTFSIKLLRFEENWPILRGSWFDLLISHIGRSLVSPHRSATDCGPIGHAHFKNEGSSLPTKTIRLVPQCLHWNLPYLYDCTIHGYLLWIPRLFGISIDRQLQPSFIVSVNTGAYMSEINCGGIRCWQGISATAPGMTHGRIQQGRPTTGSSRLCLHGMNLSSISRIHLSWMLFRVELLTSGNTIATQTYQVFPNLHHYRSYLLCLDLLLSLNPL